MIKKDDNAVRKPKSKRTQETQMLGGMPKSQEKSDNQDKVSMLQQSNEKKKKRANQRRAAKENMNDVKSQTIDNDLPSLKP